MMKTMMALALAGAALTSTPAQAAMLVIDASGYGTLGVSQLGVRFSGTYYVPDDTVSSITVSQGGIDTFSFTFTFGAPQDLSVERVLKFASGTGFFAVNPYGVSASLPFGHIIVSKSAQTSGGGGFVSYSTIGAVPEPATWAMMIAGFGLAGAALRRRHVSATLASPILI